MSPLRLKVVIPHFYHEEACESAGSGYGSGRKGNRLSRSLAFARCLGSVLSLNRSRLDFILNIASRQIEFSSPSNMRAVPDLQTDVHVFTTGDKCLEDVLCIFADKITVHEKNLSDPRVLPLTTVDSLLKGDDGWDFCLYLEDDLIVQDPFYIDKYSWFTHQTEHRFALMPHRREPTVHNTPKQLFVDGPIVRNDNCASYRSGDEDIVASGAFWGEQIKFVNASNPHSGSFCLSSQQISALRSAQWPPEEFVGPLETAATGTVMSTFSVLKPAWENRYFLTVEHGNPSFLSLIGQLPLAS